MASETDASNPFFFILESVFGQQRLQQQFFEDATTSAIASSSTSPNVPLKRKPGRPKGSVTVNRRNPNDPPKVKRPMGRPRKDGLPAGSLKHLKDKQNEEMPWSANEHSFHVSEAVDIDMTDVRQQALPQSGDGIAEENNFQSLMPTPPPAEMDIELPPNIAEVAQEQEAPGETVPEATEPPPSVHPSNIDPNLQSPPSVHLSNIDPNLQSPPSVHPSNIDPSLLGDEWLTLLRANHEERFLHFLISALTKLPYPSTVSGTAVDAAFRSHLVSLTPKENKQQPLALDTPSLYSVMKTFWLPSSPSYFSLTASASTSRIPPEHRFVYWDPLPLVFNGLACPKCSAPLANKGRIQSGPIMIHDLERPFYIIGCKYACTNADCKTTSGDTPSTYASTDSRILSALPEVLKKEFPAHLAKSVEANEVGDGELGPDANAWSWKALGVSTALWNMVRGCVIAGMGETAILSVLKGMRDGRPPEVQANQRGPGVSLQRVQDGLTFPYSGPTPYEETDIANRTMTKPFIAYIPPSSNDDGVNASDNFSVSSSTPLVKLRTTMSTAAVDVLSSASAEPMMKHIRHCRKCGLLGCSGRGGRIHCKNECQDCGRKDCPGRNIKPPDKPCTKALS